MYAKGHIYADLWPVANGWLAGERLGKSKTQNFFLKGRV